ncbi:hypothetical protein DPMN_035530 [Dreissena polymorpha]|uniref:Uncharacterized protein n=1 Tax=Dreissena polymorpha TaxID=45954 RepID=A0A9D4M7Q5_DREPO|nr:hypothetical protein DPMN_035530 [Dreissena polymorpha]
MYWGLETRSAAGACTSQPGRESPTLDLLEDFSEESASGMLIVRSCIAVSQNSKIGVPQA